MSEPNEEKIPAQEALSAREKRQQKKDKEAREAKRSRNTYIAVGIACVILAVFALSWSSGILQRNLPAASINGHNYTAADVQYYFNSTRNTYVQWGLLSSSSSLRSMVYNSETGETWYDFILQQSLETMCYHQAVEEKAKAENFEMTAATKAYLDEQLASLQNSWADSGFASLDAMIRANYGSYMTYDRLEKLVTRSMLVNDYASMVNDSFTYSDSELDAYYQEHTDSMDTITVDQFVFQATVDTTDEDGNTIEMTDEEKDAAMEEAKAAKKALAEELQAKLEAGEDPADLSEEYADDLYNFSLADARLGSSINSAYSEWALDAARKSGDVTLADYESSTAYNYYVVRFISRELDKAPGNSNSVRHILIQATDEEGNVLQFTDAEGGATEEQKAAAKAEAEDILAQWKAGEATEDSFADLAREHSADTGSAVDGGLIEDITPDAGYVENFLNWSVDDSRKPGDTGIVESIYGWHIMYYVGRDTTPVWKETADNALRADDYQAWAEEIIEGYEASQGLGMKFVQA